VAFALLGAGGFADATGTASLVFTSVLEIVLGVLIVRAWRSATMIVGEKEVVVRSLVGTRKWPRQMMREFVATTRAVGMGGWRRRVLGIVFVDGITRWLTEINSRPPGTVRRPGWTKPFQCLPSLRTLSWASVRKYPPSRSVEIESLRSLDAFGRERPVIAGV
jgi:hypothetical protein